MLKYILTLIIHFEFTEVDYEFVFEGRYLG